jgi:hypothetical protein
MAESAEWVGPWFAFCVALGFVLMWYLTNRRR